MHPAVKCNDTTKIITSGLPASPGAVQGKIVFSPDEVKDYALTDAVILVRDTRDI